MSTTYTHHCVNSRTTNDSLRALCQREAQWRMANETLLETNHQHILRGSLMSSCLFIQLILKWWFGLVVWIPGIPLVAIPFIRGYQEAKPPTQTTN